MGHREASGGCERRCIGSFDYRIIVLKGGIYRISLKYTEPLLVFMVLSSGGLAIDDRLTILAAFGDLSFRAVSIVSCPDPGSC